MPIIVQGSNDTLKFDCEIPSWYENTLDKKSASMRGEENFFSKEIEIKIYVLFGLELAKNDPRRKFTVFSFTATTFNALNAILPPFLENWLLLWNFEFLGKDKKVYLKVDIPKGSVSKISILRFLR